MSENKFALVFWSEDQQFSVVGIENIGGEVKLDALLPVVWRIKKKGVVKMSWYEAKILHFSVKFNITNMN